MKHTPGPWKIEYLNKRDNDLTYVTNGNGRDGEIAWVEPGLWAKEQKIANAKLISAAPDLLEACQSIYNSMEQSANMSIAAKEHYKNAMDKCRSAIQKATE